MSARESYKPGPAADAEVKKEGEHWTLIIVRKLKHPPSQVWQALTDPVQLREWAPFDADRSLAATGPVTLTTVGLAKPVGSETRVTRAEAPKVLEYRWADNDMRWQLESMDDGTRLTLWHKIDRRYISMGAAGWHLCFDVLGRFLDGAPLGRMVGGEAMKFEWSRLNQEYAQRFGVETSAVPPISREPEHAQ